MKNSFKIANQELLYFNSEVVQVFNNCKHGTNKLKYFQDSDVIVGDVVGSQEVFVVGC